MVAHEDVVLAVLGAASGLGAFILVFLALWVSALQAFPTGTEAAVLRIYKLVAAETVFAFVIGVVSVGACMYWLTNGQGNVSYAISLWTFVTLLVLLLLAVACVLWKLVLAA